MNNEDLDKLDEYYRKKMEAKEVPQEEPLGTENFIRTNLAELKTATENVFKTRK
jgi:hypothetical protein